VCSSGQTALGAARYDRGMRFIHLFLAGYFVFVLGIGLALWQTGVLGRMAPIWIGVGVLVAIGLGIMLSVRSGKPTLSEETER
jgi:uncharacterized membrane protein